MKTSTWHEIATRLDQEAYHLTDMVIEARGQERTAEAIMAVLEEVQERVAKADAERVA